MRFSSRSLLFGIVILFSVPMYSHAQVKAGKMAPLVANGTIGGSTTDNGSALAGLRSDIIPHSPEAEALGKYGVLPVTLYSGMPSISVPVFDLKTPGLDLPFSLSYNYNGYKPNEVASWVGLGWSLQGGGVITRIVNNQVDESMGTGGHYDDFINVNWMTWNQPFMTAVAQKQIDSEPDMYIFHIGPYSGKFILIKGKAYLFPYQNLRIVPYDQGFQITDDKGNNYYFDSYETTHQKALTPGSVIPDHKSAWYVSTIISADTKDTVSFGYTSYSYMQPNNYIETYTIDGSQSTGLNTSGHSYIEYAVQGGLISSLLMTSVTSRYGNIYFNPSSADRLDLLQSTGAKSLDNIVITNPDGSYNKQVKLYYGYFGNGYNQRLNLQSAVIRQSSPVPDSSTYRFSYAGSTSGLPDNGTKGVDMYGYYNGKDNNAMLFPAGTFTPSLYTYGDRSANAGASLLGVLNQIVYPTGGYSQLAYEQNQSGYITYKDAVSSGYNTTTYRYSDTIANGTTWSTGTFDIDSAQWVKISLVAGIDNLYDSSICPLTITTTFPIKGVGAKIIYAVPRGASDFLDSTFMYPGHYFFNLYCPKVLQWVEGGPIFHYRVPDQNTLADGPGLRVKRITAYNYDGSPQFTRQYYYNYGAGLSGGGMSGSNLHADCADYSITTFAAGLKSALSEFSDEQFFYQQVTEETQDSSQTGKTVYTYAATGLIQLDVKPVTQTDYQYKDLAYIPLRSTAYQYKSTTVNDFTSTEVLPVTVIGNACSSCFGCTMLASPDPTQAADLLTIYGPTHFTDMLSQYTQTTQELNTEYDNSGQPALSSETDYYYDNPSHLYPTRIISTNSKGEQMTTQMKYPLDYTLGQTSSLSSINQQFITDLGQAGNALDNCLGSEEVALQPYSPYHANTPANQQQFTSIASGYNCKGTLMGGAATAVANRNTAWNNYYNALGSLIASNSTSWQKGVLWMQLNNIVSPVIEKYVSLKKADGNTYLIGATRNEYNIFNNSTSVQAALPALISQVEISDSLLYSTFLAAPDTYYRPQVSFGYDGRLNLATQNKINDIKMAYLWNYRDIYPVAQVTNADTGSIAYTSFEGDNPGNWSYSGSPSGDPTAVTGQNSYLLNGANDISRSGLNSSQTYILSYWTKNPEAFSIAGTQSGYPVTGRTYNGWTYYEHSITGLTKVTISGNGAIDELRLYPAGAQMTTYAYTPLMGVTSQCSIDNRISYYGYDGLGRLKVVKDQDGNVIKTIDYHYRNPAGN